MQNPSKTEVVLCLVQHTPAKFQLMYLQQIEPTISK